MERDKGRQSLSSTCKHTYIHIHTHKSNKEKYKPRAECDAVVEAFSGTYPVPRLIFSTGTGEMFAAKPNNLSLIPRSHTVKK